LHPGGPDATLVALDKLTGETLWTSTGLSDPAAYSSPILVEAAGIPQVVNLTAKGVVGVALDDGRFLWRYDRTAGGIANIATLSRRAARSSRRRFTMRLARSSGSSPTSREGQGGGGLQEPGPPKPSRRRGPRGRPGLRVPQGLGPQVPRVEHGQDQVGEPERRQGVPHVRRRLLVRGWRRWRCGLGGGHADSLPGAFQIRAPRARRPERLGTSRGLRGRLFIRTENKLRSYNVSAGAGKGS